jgi:hypothetical protein
MSEHEQVQKVLNKLIPVFFLQGWDIEIEISEKPGRNTEVAAEIYVLNRYKDATITIYPHYFKQSKETQKRVLIHELCHIISGIQNGLLQVARQGEIVPEHEASYAYEEETSWFEKIIAAQL